MNRRSLEFFERGTHMYGGSRAAHYEKPGRGETQKHKGAIVDDASYSWSEACPTVKYFLSSENWEKALKLAKEYSLPFDPVILSSAVRENKFPVVVEQNGQQTVFKSLQEVNSVAMDLYRKLHPPTYR